VILIKNVGHVFFQMQLNAYASKAVTNAVIVGTPVRI